MDSPGLTSLLEEPPAKTSASPEEDRGWMEAVLSWPSGFLSLLMRHGPGGSFGRTSPAACQPTKDGTLAPLSEQWSNSGMACSGESLTLSLCEWNHTLVPSRKPADVCSLSDILETGAHLRRYSLSPQVSRSVIDRREGRPMPPELLEALERRATQGPSPSTPSSQEPASTETSREPLIPGATASP